MTDVQIVPCMLSKTALVSLASMSSAADTGSQELANIAADALLQALKPGGRLVYSTCSINHTENDPVVAAVLQQSALRMILLPADQLSAHIKELLELTQAQPTQFGWLVLPSARGWGPIYVSCLCKEGEVS